MDKVKVAVIGAGWWGTKAHIPALQQHPRAELIAVQARTMEKARQVANDFGIPQACTTVEEVLAIDGLNAVVVSSTPNVHYAQAKAALNQGIHVVIEKPMTITVAESLELVDIADRQGLQFLVGCPWHYNSHVRAAHHLIQSGALGQVKMVSIFHTNRVAGLYAGLPLDQAFGITSPEFLPYRMPNLSSYSDPSIAGGGQIYTQVSHVAALLGYLMHVDPVEVYARFDNAGTQVDVYDEISIRLADGTLVSLVSHGLPMPLDTRCETHISGSQGAITMDVVKGKLEYHDADGQATYYTDVPAPERYPLYAPAQNLVDAILGVAPNYSPATLGLYAMKIIEASCYSARTNTNVVIGQ